MWMVSSVWSLKLLLTNCAFLCFLADPLTYEGHISKTTAVINLKGSVDVMISPLMLEALQRYVFMNWNARQWNHVVVGFCLWYVVDVFLSAELHFQQYYTVILLICTSAVTKIKFVSELFGEQSILNINKYILGVQNDAKLYFCSIFYIPKYRKFCYELAVTIVLAKASETVSCLFVNVNLYSAQYWYYDSIEEIVIVYVRI